MSHPAINKTADATPFEFEREFSKGAVVQPRRERKKTKWTEEEVEAIRQQAYLDGEEAVRTSEETERSRQLALSAQHVGEQLEKLLDALGTERQKMREEASQIALTIARKLMPALMKTAPTAEIEAVLEQGFAQLRDEPRIVVYATPDQIQTLESTVENMVRESGFEGRLVLRSDESVAAGDVRIEWAKGAITRDTPGLDATIEKIVHTYLSAPGSGEVAQADFFSLLGK